MADPLSITASVIALLDFSHEILGYLKAVKDGKSDRGRLRDELRLTCSLLEMLRDRLEDADGEPRPSSLAFLTASDGPLHVLDSRLKALGNKLLPSGRFERLTEPLRWPLSKKEVDEIMGSIERQKSILNLVIQNDTAQLTRMMDVKVDNIVASLVDLKIINDEVQKRSDIQYRSDILAWLGKIPVNARHTDVSKTREAGTGQWFIQHEDFQKWLIGEGVVLWCPGIPGAGKSVLMSAVIDHVSQQYPRQPFAYVYCDYASQSQYSAVNIISSVLRQLLVTQPSLPRGLVKLYDLYREHGTTPTANQLLPIIRSFASPGNPVRLLFDGIDELTEECMLDLIRLTGDIRESINLLCSSRHSTLIDQLFKNIKQIEISARDEDILQLVKAKLVQQPWLRRHIQADPSLSEDISRVVVNKTHGMFLLARLRLESIGTKISRKEVRNALASLPASLDDLYQEALLRIRRLATDEAAIAEKVLSWILCAARPLKLVELQHIYATQSLAGDSAVFDADHIPDGDILTSLCGSFVTVDSFSGILRFVHYTADGYLRRVWSDRIPSASAELSQICVRFLLLDDFSLGACMDDQEMAQRLKDFPFLGYAAAHWASDISTIEDAQWMLFSRLLKDQVVLDFIAQTHHHSSQTSDGWSQRYPRNVPAIVHAARFNTLALLQYLISRTNHIDACGTDMRTALSQAAAYGLCDNIKVLLDAGSFLESRDFAGYTPLSRAAANGHFSAVQLLISRGADIASTNYGGYTVMMSAVSSGQLQIVDALIMSGAPLDKQTFRGDSAITIALRMGHKLIFTQLEQAGAILQRNRTALQARNVALTREKTRMGDISWIPRLTLCVPTVSSPDIWKDCPAVDTDESSEDSYQGLLRSLEKFKIGSSLHDKYQILRTLSTAGFVSVFSVVDRTSGSVYAGKQLVLEEYSFAMIRTEIEILGACQHPSIISMIGIISEATMITLILEFADEGDLFSLTKAREGDKFTEGEAHKIFKQIQSAVAYLHDRTVVHRDIKAENVLVMDKELTVKLADFTLATWAPHESVLSEVAGTRSYMAPEIWNGTGYGFAVDVWALGVLTYFILCGFLPFSDQLFTSLNPYSLYEQIRMGRFDYPSPYWDSISDSARDLIDRMITVGLKQRIKIADCAKHSWVQNKLPSTKETTP